MLDVSTEWLKKRLDEYSDELLFMGPELAKEVVRFREKLHNLVDEVFEASEMNMMSPSEAEGAETVARVIIDILNGDC